MTPSRKNFSPFLSGGAVALCLLLLANTSSLVHAAPHVSTTVEPIIGFERTQKFVPTPHLTSRLIYGARGTAGWRLLSAEAEYTRGTDNEAFPVDSLSVTDTADRVKLGVRSTYDLGTRLSAFLRFGGQATRNTHEETRAGVTTRTQEKIIYRPYLGTGLGINLGGKFTLNVGLTAVFNSFPDMKKNDYQTTGGFSVKFP